MILKEYNLSVRLPQEKAIDTGITLVQNDKDVYKLNIRIFDGVNEIDYSEVDNATITFLKRDNNVVQGNMTVEADRLSYTLGTNEIACPGKVLVSIQLFGATERLSTARFVISVERDLVTAEAVQSTSEFSILQKLAADVEQLKQDIVNLQIPDNSILDVKLSDAAGQIKSQVNAHLAESASKHITESGKNSNGSYIKFDDGTVVCFGTCTLSQRASGGVTLYGNLTYPVTPLSDLAVVAFPIRSSLVYANGGPGYLSMTSCTSITGTSCILQQYRYNDAPAFITGDSIELYFILLGRWK